jgi:D-sedoheptulose 7-phosphate isomerase
MQQTILKTLREHAALASSILDHASLIDDVERCATRMIESIGGGGKVIWLGNGGSAADCQHMAAELVGRFTRERAGLASLALTTDSSILTSIGNDYGFDRVFARQIEAMCASQDMVIAISTSGRSPNVLLAVEQARRMGAFTVGLTGEKGGPLSESVDLCLAVPSTVTARIQEFHILLAHILCDLVESHFATVQSETNSESA